MADLCTCVCIYNITYNSQLCFSLSLSNALFISSSKEFAFNVPIMEKTHKRASIASVITQ